MGQIIDFRAMINEATKLSNEDTGANSDPAVNHLEMRIIF